MIQLAVLVVMLACVQSACGTSCPEIRDQRAAFESRERTTRGPDARLMLPFRLMDRIIAGQVARRPPVPMALPTAKFGLDLSLALELDRVTTGPAGPGQLGLTLHLGLNDLRTRKRVLELEVDSAITPRFETHAVPELLIVLRARDLGDVRPQTTPEGIRTLGRWVRDSLPAIARGLASDAVVEALAKESLDLIAKEVWPRSKERFLGAEPLVDTRFALPDLPIRDLALTSSDRALVVDMTTDLADARAITSELDPVADRMRLRLSGGTAMGLVNRAMKRGEVPSRFDEGGKIDPQGIWETRVAWRGGASPLVVHLWRVRGECKHAEVAARVGLALQGDTVRVAVHDGRLVSVAGPAFAEAFYWLEGVFGSAMSYAFDTAAFVRFDAGADQVQVRLAKIALGESDLVLDLDVGVAAK